MSDIKFACPYCSQHIVCEGDYAGLSIDCPACGNVMVVPRLSAVDPAHPSMLVVASTPAPAPQREPIGTPPAREAWTAERWAQHVRETGGPRDQVPRWLLCVFATLMVSFAARTGGAGWPVAVGCLFLGGVFSSFLAAKSEQHGVARGILSGMAAVATIICLLPLLALAILFVGCLGCGHF